MDDSRMKKRINTRKKGQRLELKAFKILEQDGYLVYRVPGSTKWNRNVDMYGLWDLLGIKKNIGNDTVYIKLIQVKSKKPVLKEWQDFADKYRSFNLSCEIWWWKARQGFQEVKL